MCQGDKQVDGAGIRQGIRQGGKLEDGELGKQRQRAVALVMGWPIVQGCPYLPGSAFGWCNFRRENVQLPFLSPVGKVVKDAAKVPSSSPSCVLALGL